MVLVTNSVLKPVAFLLLAALLVQTATADDVLPLNKYSGVIRQDALKQLAPESGVVINQTKLSELWKAWSIEGAMPDIDFQTQMVLVDLVPGPNRSFSGPLMLDNGNLTYRVASTKMGGPGFGYLMMVVPREGIVTVNDKPIPAAEQPQNPGLSEPADSIVVTMVGTLQTGVMAIGGETTGYTISSGGLTWELDFRNAEQINLAMRLESENRKARVTGRLSQIAGIEVKQRMIVSVDQIVDAAEQPPRVQPNVQPRELEAATTRPRLDSRPAGNPGLAEEPGPGQTPALDMSQLNGFRSIKITMSSEALAGQVTQEVQPNGISSIDDGSSIDKYAIPPDRLKQLHEFVKQTNWADVPRNSRGGRDKPTQFEIEIRAPAGIYRLFIEDDRLKDVDAIAQLFRLLRKS